MYSVGGGSKKKKLKKISLALYQRVAYNMAKDATNALFAPLKNTQIYKVKQHIKLVDVITNNVITSNPINPPLSYSIMIGST